MELDPGHRFVTAIQGQLLRWSERREVAIYLRDDALWSRRALPRHTKNFTCGRVKILMH
jgi:hypothetical protein